MTDQLLVPKIGIVNYGKDRFEVQVDGRKAVITDTLEEAYLVVMRPIMYGLRRSTEALLRHANPRTPGPAGSTIRIPLRTYKAWIHAFEALHFAEDRGLWAARDATIGHDHGGAVGAPNRTWGEFWSACHGLYDMGWSEALTYQEATSRIRDNDADYRRPEASRPALTRIAETIRGVRHRPLRAVN